MLLAHAATAIAGFAIMWATVATAVAARAGSVPDAAQMSELRKAAAKVPVLLVRGDFGLREVHHAQLDSTGVRSPKWESEWRQRPAVIGTADASPVAMPSPIAWSEIASLQTQHPQKLKGALFGGITGLAAAILVVGLSHDTAETDEITPAEGWALSLPPLGIAVGFVAGALTGTRTIYPQDQAATGQRVMR